MEPRFYLSSKINKQGRASVMLFISTHGKRITISTGKFIKPENWNERSQRARGTTKETLEFNNFLISFGSKAVGILSFLIDNNEPEIIKKFKCKIKNEDFENKLKVSNDLNGTGGSFLNFIKDYFKRANKSQATKDQYEDTMDLLEEFQKESFKRPIDFETVDLVFYDEFLTFCKGKKDYAINTIGKYIKNIKFLMGQSEAEGLHSNMKFLSKKFKKPTEESFSIYLSESELKKMYTHDFSKEPEKEKVRDLFIASCWISVRISDLLFITKANIHGNLISIRSIKTNEFVDIPIHRTVKEIIEKYNGIFPNDISEQEFNNLIKEIACDVEINEEIAYSITKGGEKRTIIKPKYKLISAHTARRSFATNLYKRGLPVQTIMAITGHETEKSFRLYVKSKRIDAVKNLNTFFND